MNNQTQSIRLLVGAAVLSLGVASEAIGAIVGGRTITIEEAPWQMLLLTDEEGGSTGNCAASWIGGRWALTAAHCVKGNTASQVSLYAGITRRNEAKPSHRLGVSRIISHPDHPKQWKDIALLEMSSDVTAVLARPIRIVTPQDEAAGVGKPGVVVMATGWGGVNRSGRLADTLQAVNSKVKEIAPYTLSWAGFGGSQPIGSCGGDSGGPCVVKDAAGTDWVLAGISSFITSFCGDPDSPSSYTRVSAFSNWIQGYTGMTVAVRPLPGGDGGLLLLPGNGRFTLRKSRTLDLTVADLTGAVVGRSRGFYAAGEYPVPGKPSPGAHVLLIRGEDVEIRQSF